MLNPGFKARISEKDFRSEIDPGPMLFCPKCGKPLMEAVVERVYQRCKHCRKWVFMQKTPVREYFHGPAVEKQRGSG
jgi:DNA-directed RNA polymerase subunit RPC12/RpoP